MAFLRNLHSWLYLLWVLATGPTEDPFWRMLRPALLRKLRNSFMSDVTLEKLKSEITTWFTRRAAAMSAQAASDAAVANQTTVFNNGVASVNAAQAAADNANTAADADVTTANASLDVANLNEHAQANYIAGLLGLPGFPPIDDPSPDDAGS